MARKQIGILTSEKNAEAEREVFAFNLVVHEKGDHLKNSIKGKTNKRVVGKQYQNLRK